MWWCLMPRGVPHSPELRAQVVAAVLAGASLAAVAKQFGLRKQTISQWLQTEAIRTVRTTRANERTPEALEAMIFDLVVEHIATLRAQLQAAATPAYVQGQPAGDLAALLGTERDTLIRLLAGFRPVEPAPGLPAPADTPPGPADDAD
jgi:transposase-like protein